MPRAATPLSPVEQALVDALAAALAKDLRVWIAEVQAAPSIEDAAHTEVEEAPDTTRDENTPLSQTRR